MAKKLTKAEIAKIKRLAKIAKNPTAAINSGKMKMKKQEVPLAGIGKAAARVIGKAIVNATTGKTAARKYAESSMRADTKRAAAKKSAKSVKEALKNAKKSKPLANPKSAVKVKPAARQKPNKPNAAKTIFKNDSSRNRASDKAYKKVEAETKKYKVEERTGYEHQYASDAAERAGMNAKLKRKPNLNIKRK